MVGEGTGQSRTHFCFPKWAYQTAFQVFMYLCLCPQTRAALRKGQRSSFLQRQWLMERLLPVKTGKISDQQVLNFKQESITTLRLKCQGTSQKKGEENIISQMMAKTALKCCHPDGYLHRTGTSNFLSRPEEGTMRFHPILKS